MFVKRYELVLSGEKFYLRYSGPYAIKRDGCLNEEYTLNATNWEEAEREAEKLIEQFKKENKIEKLIICYD